MPSRTAGIEVDGENEIVALPPPCTPCSNAKAASRIGGFGLRGTGLAYWGPSAEIMDINLDTDVHVS